MFVLLSPRNRIDFFRRIRTDLDEGSIFNPLDQVCPTFLGGLCKLLGKYISYTSRYIYKSPLPILRMKTVSKPLCHSPMIVGGVG